MGDFVTLEELMEKTANKFSCDFNRIGKGVVCSDKVRVYQRFLGRLAPAKIKLDWNDDDAVPFVYYTYEKRRIQFGSSDERHPDLFNKMERCRFNYSYIDFKGRLWSKRKIIVFAAIVRGPMFVCTTSGFISCITCLMNFWTLLSTMWKTFTRINLYSPKQRAGVMFIWTLSKRFLICVTMNLRVYTWKGIHLLVGSG